MLGKLTSKIFLICSLSFLLAPLAAGTTLDKIRFGQYPDKIRAVFDFSAPFDYKTEAAPDKILLHLKDTQAGPAIDNYVEINDLALRHLEVETENSDLKITIPLTQSTDYKIFALDSPPRLVIDFDREYLNIVSGGTVADGVELLKIKKGVTNGTITAAVLKIDLSQATLKPALALKGEEPSFLESLANFFRPVNGQEKHFSLDKVSNIAADNQALAAINGTYFDYSGQPLGALMIDQTLLSFPIYDRTAFFLDAQNTPHIDSLAISSQFRLDSGCYKITGINQLRGKKDIIMYTSVWGETTKTNSLGLELVVIDGKINAINLGNSKVPANGYVLSINDPALETLAEKAIIGQAIKTEIKIIPYASSPENIIQLISGGPRLLKNGQVYVSKHEEKFKYDIASGRAARTAIGITQDKHLLLVTVNGRPRQQKGKNEADSLGATLEELSNIMLGLGAVEAMNLDGGGSSTMVINNQVINQPVDGSQRRISNALLVMKKNRLP
ncbi:hypothetical protein COT42_05130 [Candidatus Saganbacteria bacterium CG08_land_8_20_14_0_20_45_16]|uniref:Phosphodiester glycosidase domain-containing protein n=1 Tax=Candidatus Saganbacteria bacterium CG08_land_8_20_14_0_20_45_16 TaxID=2014293 RepID=A0A2H0XX44_UNCSA|nr:MAG: hypothetical protein COT42_05130 [Candidatus Saganbacteria bacterium CG08_land_8_20_14_0_20_45_16]